MQLVINQNCVAENLKLTNHYNITQNVIDFSESRPFPPCDLGVCVNFNVDINCIDILNA